MSNIAFIFPGQGSQKIGMLSELLVKHSVIADTFIEASDITGLDMVHLIIKGPEQDLNLTQNTQPVLLAASVALWRLWQEKRDQLPSVVAGHSLGEYSALVCAGAISFTDGLKLVQKRGIYMQEVVKTGDGAMAAVLGLDDDAVVEVCKKVSNSLKAVLSAVNFNAPGQVVIAGDRKAVEASMANLKKAGARKVVLLPVSVPSHCALMKPAADRLEKDLREISIETPTIAVVQNATASFAHTPVDIFKNLVLQLFTPVRWVESIQTLATQGVEVFYECGPGKVLSGLNKRIAKEVPVVSLENSNIFDLSNE